jgi:hypothetical protein
LKNVFKIKTINIDGTTYNTEDWIKESFIINNLRVGSKIWIPSKDEYGTLVEIKLYKYDNFNNINCNYCNN